MWVPYTQKTTMIRHYREDHKLLLNADGSSKVHAAIKAKLGGFGSAGF